MARSRASSAWLPGDKIDQLIEACQAVIDTLRPVEPDDANSPTPREAVAYWFKVRKWLDWDKPAYRADAHRAECHAQVRAWTAIARRQDVADRPGRSEDTA